jgi:hypothetical protein
MVGDSQAASQRLPNRDGVKPKKLVLIAIITIANGIGVFPYLLFIDRVHYLPVLVAVTALIGFLPLRPLQTDAMERPSLSEWLLAAWSAVAYPSTAASVGFNYVGYRVRVSVGLVWVRRLIVREYHCVPII